MSSDQFIFDHEKLSILKLSAPILAASERGELDDEKRTSMASSAAEGAENPTPASLEADLKHYQELFTKLRFSYVEQVTKEKFLRAVVGDPPIFVDQADNVVFESQLLEVKASLKAQKMEVAECIKQLEAQSRDLSRRYRVIELQQEQLQNLPFEIESLQETLDTLRRQQTPQSSEPSLSLPLPASIELLATRQAELDELDRQLALLESESKLKADTLAQEEARIEPLRTQKTRAVIEAKEAKKRKELSASGVGDELEERGRWLSGVRSTMQSLLDVEG